MKRPVFLNIYVNFLLLLLDSLLIQKCIVPIAFTVLSFYYFSVNNFFGSRFQYMHEYLEFALVTL